MIKTDLQLLEDNRDQAQSMVLALTAQIGLMKGKIVGLGDNPDRDKREAGMAVFEKELDGHKKMVRELDRMIEEEKKNAETIRGTD